MDEKHILYFIYRFVIGLLLTKSTNHHNLVPATVFSRMSNLRYFEGQKVEIPQNTHQEKKVARTNLGWGCILSHKQNYYRTIYEIKNMFICLL